MALFMILCLVGLFTFGSTTPTAIHTYSNHKVYRVTPSTDQQALALIQLHNNGVRFWEGPSKIGRPSDILISPEQEQVFQNVVDEFGLETDVLIPDVGKLIAQEALEGINQDESDGRLLWDRYYNLDDIYAFLVETVGSNPNTTSLINIGKTTEGRDLWVIKISKDNNNNGSTTVKPVIFIDANIHAREWITSAVATYLINELVNKSDCECEIGSWTEDFDWYILPIVNPDGFQYTHTTDRLWRKSRSIAPDSTCRGVDLNRNFEYHWLQGGSSSSPCSDTYAGEGPFSSPETRAIADFINTIGNYTQLYLSLHSYSQFIMFPYGDTANITEYDRYMDISQKAADALHEKFNTTFTPGNWLDILYLSTGTSMDWVKSVHEVSIALTYELRDQGRYGFILPAQQIIPSSMEFIDSLFPLIRELRSLF